MLHGSFSLGILQINGISCLPSDTFRDLVVRFSDSTDTKFKVSRARVLLN